MRFGRNVSLLILIPLTLIHQYVALEAWPFPTQVARVIWNTPAPLLLLGSAAILATFQLLSWAHAQAGFAKSLYGRGTVALTASALCVVAYLLGDGQWFQGGDTQLMTPRSAMWLGLGSVIVAGLLSAFAQPARGNEHEAHTKWTWREIMACTLLIVNVLLLVIPEMPQLSGHAEPAIAGKSEIYRIFNAQFKLFYADVMAFRGNPLFDIPRSLFVLVHDQYFSLMLATMYIAALSIALFCGAASPILGYYGSFAAAFGIVFLKHVLWIVFSTNNTVTLFLAASLSVFLLSRILTSLDSGISGWKVMRLGVGLGGIAVITLYTYAASRSLTYVSLGLCWVALLVGCLKFPTRRSVFYGGFFASLLVPSLFLALVYGLDLQTFWTDFHKSIVPATPNIHDTKPDFVPTNEYGMSPDLPSYIGMANAKVPTIAGSTESRTIFWKRSLSEIFMVTTFHVRRILEVYFPFPGGFVPWLCIGASLGALSTRFNTFGKRILLLSGIVALSVLYLTPFIAVLASTEWRRGAAVLLPFGALVGSGLFFVLQALFPRLSGPLLVGAVFLIGLATISKPGIVDTKKTSVFDIRIQHDCLYNPAKALVGELRKREFSAARIVLIASQSDVCSRSLVHILRSKIGADRVLDISPSRNINPGDLNELLHEDDFLVIDCGFSRHPRIEGLCSQLGSIPKARLVETSAGALNNLWLIAR